MKRMVAAWVCVWVLAVAAAGVSAQSMKAAKPAVTAPRLAYYIDPAALDLEALIPNPPAVGSATGNAELDELHRIEKARTAEQTAAARADEDEEDLFAYKTVLGAGFNAAALPLTAELGVHVKNEQSVAGGALKVVFARARPYQTDKTLHPACALTAAANSYPSGP